MYKNEGINANIINFVFILNINTNKLGLIVDTLNTYMTEYFSKNIF